MGFGFADLVVAVPAFWIDVADMADLDAAAAEFRARHGHRLRVATKYHHSSRAFFQRPRRRRLPARRQPGRDRGHGEEPDRRGGGRHHHHRLDAARQPPAHPRRRGDPASQATLFALARGAAGRRRREAALARSLAGADLGVRKSGAICPEPAGGRLSGGAYWIEPGAQRVAPAGGEEHVVDPACAPSISRDDDEIFGPGAAPRRAASLRWISTSAALRVCASQTGTGVDVGLEQHARRRHLAGCRRPRRRCRRPSASVQQRPDRRQVARAASAGRTRRRARPSCTCCRAAAEARGERARGRRQRRARGASEHSDLGEPGGERRRKVGDAGAGAERSRGRVVGAQVAPALERRGAAAAWCGRSRGRGAIAQRSMPSSPVRGSSATMRWRQRTSPLITQ